MNKEYRIETADLDKLIQILLSKGYDCIGPVVRGHAIEYHPIQKAKDLPVGWNDVQEPGKYRIHHDSKSSTYFGFNESASSWKSFLFPPKLSLYKAKRTEDGFEVYNSMDKNAQDKKYAFIGVRPCDLKAIEIQDKFFVHGNEGKDAVYTQRRKNAFIVVVNCSTVASTCFCSAMKTGPKSKQGFDLALTEIVRTEEHYFILESGSEKGEHILRQLNPSLATTEEQGKRQAVTTSVEKRQVRHIDINGMKEKIYNSYESEEFNKVGERCLACTNCTLVCPTCFCSNVEDTTDLTGQEAERIRTWASCLNLDFSYVHGGETRKSTSSRYRQWLTHKMASWQDQFGTSGCVGCGRCIAWCPVGIDITEETNKLLNAQKAGGQNE